MASSPGAALRSNQVASGNSAAGTVYTIAHRSSSSAHRRLVRALADGSLLLSDESRVKVLAVLDLSATTGTAEKTP